MFKLYDFSFLIFSGILDTFFQGNLPLLQIQSLPSKTVGGKISVKDTKGNILILWVKQCFWETPTCGCGMKIARDGMQMNDCGSVPIKLYLENIFLHIFVQKPKFANSWYKVIFFLPLN